MNSQFNTIKNQFDTQIKKVFSIMEFDKDFIKLAIQQLQDNKSKLIAQGIENPSMLPDTTISILEAVCKSGPSRQKYKPILNQSLVLLVSYFASAVSDVFNCTLVFLLEPENDLPTGAAKEEYKFTLQEIKKISEGNSQEIGKLISRKCDVSYQDMQSIYRLFNNFYKIKIPKTIDVQNIIAAQALRHAVVHNAEIVDSRCERQITHAAERSAFPNINQGSSVNTSQEDLNIIASSMHNYLNELFKLLNNKFNI